MADIPPGPLSRTTANRLNAHARRVRENQEELVRRLKNPPTPIVLARVTDYDATSNAYTWYEQAVGADGVRYTKPGGRSGSPTFAPAYGIGDGDDAITTLPADVTLRLATVTTTVGPVYEFPTVCACLEGGSGGGGGGGGGGGLITSLCCPAGVPATQTAYFTISGGQFSTPAAQALRWVVGGSPVAPAALEIDPGTFWNFSYIVGTATVTRVGIAMVTRAVMNTSAVIRDEFGDDLVTMNSIEVQNFCYTLGGGNNQTNTIWTFNYTPIAGCGLTPHIVPPFAVTACVARPWFSASFAGMNRSAACPNPTGTNLPFGLYTYA